MRNAGTGNGSGTTLVFRGVSNASAEHDYAYVAGVADDTTAKTGSIRFSTTAGSSPVERARITSGGDFRVKGAGTAGSTEAFQVSGSAPADAARLTSSGEFLVGTSTSQASKIVADTTSGNAVWARSSVTANAVNITWNSDTSGDNLFETFFTDGGPSSRGSITYNRAGGLVAYNTTSDYRAKDIIGSVTNAGATIDALKVYNGKMKGATVERPMLIAHEAQAVTPYAVTGEKDAVDEDGKPKYQQMDVSSLVPLLIAEIQSLRARVAQLEAK
jgi:hypothetical protein